MTDPTKHNHWLAVGEGLRITKHVLEGFLQIIVDDWYNNKLLTRLRSSGTCGTPKTCKALQINSLCQCCRAWYQELKCLHTGKVKSKIQWNNTNCSKWASDTPGGNWEVAKVFMSHLGDHKTQVTNAQTTDIAGLLTMLRFLPDEAFPSGRVPRDLIENVSNKARNPWAHSSQQEMEKTDEDDTFDNLCNLLKDKAFKAGYGISELKRLSKEGITNVSSSELTCLIILAKELAADVAQIKSDIGTLNKTSSDHTHKIEGLQNKMNNLLIYIQRCDERITKVSETGESSAKELGQAKESIKKLLNEACDVQKSIEEMKKRLDEHEARLDDLEEWKKTHKEKKETSLENCIPDFQDKAFGRDGDIEYIVSLIQNKRKPCVVLTGGPGFGKTTLAIQVANKLQQDIVLFVRLRQSQSIEDVCSRILTIIGQKPDDEENKELLLWARSLNEKRNVILILDNSEDVLQNQRDKFCGLLQDLRTCSNNLQFLVTSRESFKLQQMDLYVHIVKELNEEQGADVIQSMVSHSSNLQRERLKKLATLCGGVPLALRMIGSLLNDYLDIDVLIDEMGKSPFGILEDEELQDDHKSVRMAFDTSFSTLKDPLKVKLVQLSVFEGPFEEKAASGIWKEKERLQVTKNVRSLTKMSFLSKSTSQTTSTARYELHPLIQRYLLVFKEGKYNQQLSTAKNNFVIYFTSLIIEGNELFWSKDQFKSSMEMFRNDTMNIEKSLNMFHEKPARMERFFPGLTLLCTYLDMCMSYKHLESFLQLCQDSAEKLKDIGAQVETHCNIAYYKFKKGDSEGYRKHTEEATKMYDDAQLSKSQEWSYKLVGALDRTKAYQLCKEALNLARENTEGTDLTLSLSQLGKIQKNGENYNYNKAEKSLKECLEKRKEKFGEQHILTAMVGKHLADLYLTKKEYHSNENALKQYEETFSIYKAIGMDNEKQCIYLLKNIGCCLKYLGKITESLEQFHIALNMSEGLLERDHQVKLQIYSSIVNIYNKSDETLKHAKCYAITALEMAERLGMGNEKKFIYLLKSVGFCCKSLKQYEEALRYLDMAIELSEEQSAGDYKVKVEIYGEMATIYNQDDETLEKAKYFATKALEMAARLEMTDWIGNGDLNKILNSSV